MSARFFLDTNVFVYSLDTTSVGKRRRAQELIGKALSTRSGVVSYQVVQEFFNVALRKFAQTMTAIEAEQYLTTVFRPLLSVGSSIGLYTEALQLCKNHRLSWYDALVVASALEGQCEVLYSEDFQHGWQIEDLRIENPFRLIV